MSRRPLVAGNWKMNKSLAEAERLARLLVGEIGRRPDRDVLVAPPFIALDAVRQVLRGSGILLAAQNMHFEESGAFTGEISGEMLNSVGCSHVILGHSERRHVFGESDELIGRKVIAALRQGLIPIVCVGETLEERRKQEAETVVQRQLSHALKGLTKPDGLRIIVAYEPVWAIGTGQTATPGQAQEMHVFVRNVVADLFDSDLAAALRILYGGSVKPDNINHLMSEPDLDGALVGGASLNAEDFVRIVNYS